MLTTAANTEPGRRAPAKAGRTLLALAVWLGAGPFAGLPPRALAVAGAGLVHATYLGGTNDEADEFFGGVADVAVDGAGNVYVAASTRSADFPTTPGADRALDGSLDVVVTKLSPAGAVLYSTYLGGPCEDFARGIAVDAAGNAWVTGRANSGVCFTDRGPGVLVAKLGPTGAVAWTSVLGGRLADASVGRAIAVDADGHAYVTGVANASSHDFPTTPGALRTGPCANVYSFAGDGFVAKLSPDGRALLYATLLCGSGDDVPSDIAVDAAGHAYVAGVTGSVDFPTVAPLQAVPRGGPVSVTGFVSKLSPDGARLVYSTYLGGAGSSAINGLAIDGQGSAYVTGETDTADFPTTPGVLQPQAGTRHCIQRCTDAFVAKLDPTGSALAYSTYLFGELDESGAKIAVDAGGHAWIVGATASRFFPIVDAFQPANRGAAEAFVARLDPAGARLLLASYLGGSHAGTSPRTGWDHGTAIALDAGGGAWVAGYTQSYDFPATADAFQPRLAEAICDVLGTACGDVFVARVTAGGGAVTPPVDLHVTPGEAAPGGTLAATWAGIPAPGADDFLRLYELGSSGDAWDDAVVWWPTTGAAAGTLSLRLPHDLAVGWYELRLLHPDPQAWNLPAVIARSAPILVTTAPRATTTTTTLPAAACDAAACDDGDPCTVEECVAGGCGSTPAAGLAGVACACRRAGPAACAGQAVPPALAGRRQRACGLVDEAGMTDRALARKRLRKAATTLGAALRAVRRARPAAISHDCAGALAADLRDARDRAVRFLNVLRRDQP